LENTPDHPGNGTSKEKMIYAFIPCTKNTVAITNPASLFRLSFVKVLPQIKPQRKVFILEGIFETHNF
jgi:hypothetical protein